MDTEVDLTTVDRAVLIAIIAELQAVIERLQRRIAELEGQAKPGDPGRMPGLKAKSARKPPAQHAPQAATPRLRPPAHDTDPSGGARDGELPRLRPPVRRLDPAHSGSHRAAGGCNHRARLPCSDLPGADGAAHLRRYDGPGPAPRRQPAQPDRHAARGGCPSAASSGIWTPICASAWGPSCHSPNGPRWPRSWTVRGQIHADETGWREDGANGRVAFSTPTERSATSCRGRGKAVVNGRVAECWSAISAQNAGRPYRRRTC